MAEPNIASTATILGKTNVLNLTQDWQTIVFNNLNTQSALKVNSLFVTNRQTSLIDIDIRLGREAPNSPLATYPLGNFYQLVHTLSVPSDATLVAICRDNPVWLQRGDSLQMRAGANFRADAVCSYEYISDLPYTPPPSNASPATPQQLTMYMGHFSGTTPGTIGSPSSCVLNWFPPASHGTTPLIDYIVKSQVYEAGATRGDDKLSDFEPVVKAESTRTQLQITNVVNTLFTLGGASTLYNPGVLSVDTSGARYFRFAVAAKNSIGVGNFVATQWMRFDVFPPPVITNATPVDKGVTISLTQTPQTGITIDNYYVRWTRDNGITWEPGIDGVAINQSDVLLTDIQVGNVSGAAPYLQNGVVYRFSVRALGHRLGANNLVEPIPATDPQIITSPWSMLSQAVIPVPQSGSVPQQLRTMFVSWDQD